MKNYVNPKKKLLKGLSGISKTLLPPLQFRAEVSLRHKSFFYDKFAIQLMQKFKYSRELKFASDEIEAAIGLPLVVRAYQFDKIILKFIKLFPQATVINLGAGLDTTFWRIDNGKITWADLDFPPVINLRKKLLPSNPRIHMISKSVLDFSWIKKIKKLPPPYFFMAGGLFMYLKRAEVKSVFMGLVNNFSDSQLLFDSMSKTKLQDYNKRSNAPKDLGYKWSFDQSSDLEKWSSHIKVVADIRFFEKINTKKYFSLLERSTISILNYNERIIQVKFK